jgi:hypothetical protein
MEFTAAESLFTNCFDDQPEELKKMCESATSNLVFFGRALGNEYVGFETGSLPCLRLQIQGSTSIMFAYLSQVVDACGIPIDKITNNDIENFLIHCSVASPSLLHPLHIAAGSIAYIPGGVVTMEVNSKNERSIGVKALAPNFVEDKLALDSMLARMKFAGIKPDDRTNMLAVMVDIGTRGAAARASAEPPSVEASAELPSDEAAASAEAARASAEAAENGVAEGAEVTNVDTEGAEETNVDAERGAKRNLDDTAEESARKVQAK